jgi:hypothetical protein
MEEGRTLLHTWKFLDTMGDLETEEVLNNLLESGYQVRSVTPFPQPEGSDERWGYHVVASLAYEDIDDKSICQITGVYRQTRTEYCKCNTPVRFSAGEPFPPCPHCFRSVQWELQKGQ